MSKNDQYIQLRSEEVQEILTSIPTWMVRWGSTLLTILIFIILFIAWFIKYPDIINTKAVLTTQIPPQKIFASRTANFDSIYVEDGQAVNKEELLAVFDNTANISDVLLLKSIIDTLKISKNNFYFPIENLPLLFLGDLESKYATFETTYYDYIIKQTYSPYANKVSANNIALSELSRRLASIEFQLKLAKKELEIKEKEFSRYRTLFDKDVISKQEFDSHQMSLLKAEQNYKSFEDSYSSLKETLILSRSSNSLMKYDRIRNDLLLLKETIQAFNQLKAGIELWLIKNALIAKQDGKVYYLNNWSQNQTVNSGDPIFIIVPEKTSNYLAKLWAPSQNAGKLRKGLMVNIHLKNYPSDEFGTLSGQVLDISYTPNQDGYYLVDVLLPDALITSFNRKIEFRQEMPADAEIITEDLRLLERFFYQLKSLFN